MGMRRRMNDPTPHPAHRRRIDPAVRRTIPGANRPDGTPDDDDRVEIGPTPTAFAAWAEAGLRAPNLAAMRRYRLDRLVAEINRRDLAGLLCFDPINIRYATDTTNMQVWIAHNPNRACFVAADGHLVLWDFKNCEHLSAHLPLISEVRSGVGFFHMMVAERVDEVAARFAAEVAELMRAHGDANRRLAVDQIEVAGVAALQALGITLYDGKAVADRARAIKGPDEIRATRCAIHSCEIAMRAMQDALTPGMTEADLWAVLHAENIRHGGEWIETRLLSSGPRTNPR